MILADRILDYHNLAFSNSLVLVVREGLNYILDEASIMKDHVENSNCGSNIIGDINFKSSLVAGMN